MNRLLLILVAALVLTSCGALDSLASTTTTTEPVVAEPDPPPTTLPETDSGTVPPCLSGDRPFAADGVISGFGGANGDATQVAGIRWASYPGCERLVVDLLTADGAPAGAIDPVGVDYRALEGVIRINLPPAISRSAVSDSLFDGALIQRAFVIATDDNQIAIDVHATPGNTLSLRAFEVASPSRIVIDVRTEENTTAVLGATLGTGVVVISPLTTETATNVVVSGYARGSTNGLLVRAFSAGDTAPITEEAVELRGESNLWREFAVELADLPARPLEITVGFRGAAGAEATRVTFDATDRRIPDPPEV